MNFAQMYCTIKLRQLPSSKDCCTYSWLILAISCFLSFILSLLFAPVMHVCEVKWSTYIPMGVSQIRPGLNLVLFYCEYYSEHQKLPKYSCLQNVPQTFLPKNHSFVSVYFCRMPAWKLNIPHVDIQRLDLTVTGTVGTNCTLISGGKKMKSEMQTTCFCM